MQHVILRKAMAYVLNFHPGNEPTSLQYLIGTHKKYAVTKLELEHFKCSFIEVCGSHIKSVITNSSDEPTIDDIQTAWTHLFEEVLEYLELGCVQTAD